MLQFTGCKSLRVHVGNFFKLEGAFKGSSTVKLTSDVKNLVLVELSGSKLLDDVLSVKNLLNFSGHCLKFGKKL